MRRDSQLIQLLTPPFDTSDLEPGYIKGYVPGVRENGGQYTHAAIWAATAFALLGDTERAWELFAMLNPINHAREPQHTGAAGWMYRLSVETLLGLQLQVDRLRIAPCIPAHWETYKIHYRYRETVYHITVKHVAAKPDDPIRVTLDGAAVDGAGVDEEGRPQGMIPLVDDRREHYVDVDINQ